MKSEPQDAKGQDERILITSRVSNLCQEIFQFDVNIFKSKESNESHNNQGHIQEVAHPRDPVSN